MTREQALRKIQACLRLAASSNATEAATALRQARALMDRYGLTEADAASSEIGDAEATTGFRGDELPLSLMALATVVADGYRCRVIGSQQRSTTWRGDELSLQRRTVVRFLGAGADPQIAAYAFTVLRRQLQKDKRKHVSRVRKQANRERRAEEFALGWVTAVRRLFPSAELPERRAAAIEQALNQRYGELTQSTGKQFKGGRVKPDDFDSGFDAGRGAYVNQGLAEGQAKLEHLP
ncbi:DUF2786 domain-containing protein [Stenotrophomonas sp. B1-1]|uniref:DUF2786 domain-containing protein n=1 Tax=Stenotrophomonas sp. B1-1 TaxID=2710648 RepID=UPI0013DC6C0F|nr:DUF2786 domain-containing protein [Stenotrophomonas sp. B1-1]